MHPQYQEGCDTPSIIRGPPRTFCTRTAAVSGPSRSHQNCSSALSSTKVRCFFCAMQQSVTSLHEAPQKRVFLLSPLIINLCNDGVPQLETTRRGKWPRMKPNFWGKLQQQAVWVVDILPEHIYLDYLELWRLCFYLPTTTSGYPCAPWELRNRPFAVYFNSSNGHLLQ